ncbi:MAG: DUF4330 domain-containing protein, partial [Oscillospiraceae bacterium]|nr:DUF4330 domain-containing protein [Oscillospiraceae bacterium]
MKLIDNKGRLGGKLSVIDLVIILLIIAIAIGVYLQFFVFEQTAVTVDVHPVRYTLQTDNVRDWAMRNIREGDAVFAAGGVYVGTVYSIESIPFEVSVSSDGLIWLGEVP